MVFPEYKTVKVANLVPYARNSRTHSAEQVAQIAASIREFGFTNPLLIDEQGGIIAGHGRLLAAQKLGFDEVPAITLQGLSDAQKKAYVIADNKLALNAGWDDEMLRVEFMELQEMGFDLELTGFSLDEIASMFGQDGKPELDRKMLNDKAEQLEQMTRRLHFISEGLRHAAICPAENHMQCPTFQGFLKAAITGSLKRTKIKPDL